MSNRNLKLWDGMGRLSIELTTLVHEYIDKELQKGVEVGQINFAVSTEIMAFVSGWINTAYCKAHREKILKLITDDIRRSFVLYEQFLKDEGE